METKIRVFDGLLYKTGSRKPRFLVFHQALASNHLTYSLSFPISTLCSKYKSL